ncbi:hypothetical protein JHK87_022882 [Glycine soja]|nr:hypothetical protein JHK87_022882 [Glycine soja]
MEKTLVEFCLLHDYQLRHLGPAAKILTLDLSSRNDLCINPWVLVVENRVIGPQGSAVYISWHMTSRFGQDFICSSLPGHLLGKDAILCVLCLAMKHDSDQDQMLVVSWSSSEHFTRGTRVVVLYPLDHRIVLIITK